MIDFRLRTRIHPSELEQKIGKILTDEDYNVLITKDATFRGPDGTLLGVYLRGVIPPELRDQSYPTLHSLRNITTNNRGLASGTPRVKKYGGPGSKHTQSKTIASSIVGSFESAGHHKYCRLTAWTGKETEKYQEMWPLLRFIGGQFKKHVPDRYAKQMEYVSKTQPEWIIPGTPFSTVTVNNTYPTGVHQDKGDLDVGFSTLAVLRRGNYDGGIFIIPEFRVGIDLRDGDLMLMDAHQWHGNTKIEPLDDEAERISVVSYYRTKMASCGSAEEEAERAIAYSERRSGLGSA